MKKVINRSYAIFILVAAFAVMLGILTYRYAVYGATWATKSINTHIFTNGNLTTAGTIYDRNDVALVSTDEDTDERTYNDDFYTRISTLHIVGDKAGLMSSSVQNLYRSSLVGYSWINGIYNTINGNNPGITLTIDSQVNAIAYKALNGSKGAVMAYNYKTGEVICATSAPTYDPENAPSSDTLNNDSKYEGVFINRCINGLFTPGSTMKIITTICALENISDIESRTFTCTGSKTYGGETVKCSGVHGKQTLKQALNHSCNIAFADIATELGAKKLKKTATELGFGKTISVGKMTSSKSQFDLSDASTGEIGWAGVGQYTTLVTPVQMLCIAGAIANEGTCVNPCLILDTSEGADKQGVTNENITVDPTISAKMQELLRSNVEDYYGDSNFPGLTIAGKTGSAERGTSSNGSTLRHCWFVGYSADESFPYAIVVIMENQTSGSGYSKAVPVANKVLQAIKEYDS